MKELFALFMESGPIILSTIFIFSFVALVIIIEKILYFKKINVNEEKILNRLESSINKGHFDEALTICDTAPSPITNLMKAGIKHRNYSEHYIQDAIKDAASLEIPKLEKNLSTLGTIANVAPLLGLLGTVIGNMQAFGIIGNNAKALGDMTVLAGGISKALITTAFGLIVAIPASIFYNYLTNKVNNIILTLETKANELVLMLIRGKKQGLIRGKNGN